jgi:hypothetical protein
MEFAAFIPWNLTTSTVKKVARCKSARIHSTLELTPNAVCSINMSIALDCLQRTTPTIELEYPHNDAIEHFNEIRLAMLPWAQNQGNHHYHKGPNFNGPWIENYWISHFETLWDEKICRSNASSQVCLSDYFGPFIPIFVPLVDQFVNSDCQYPSGLVDTLLSVLRPKVPYVIVSQNDVGLDMPTPPNVLVLSAGGYGHVPVPLFKQNEDRNNDVDVANRTIDMSYVGSLGNEPHNMRQRLHDNMLTFRESSNTTWTYEYYHGNNWKEVMRNSRWSLVPRGFGRTAYHLMETLQMGLVPVYVYYDVPWVPYMELFREIGYVTDASSLPDLITNHLLNATWDEIRDRERRIEALRTSHFSPEGAMEQIGYFLIGKTNDLRCQELPPSPNRRL